MKPTSPKFVICTGNSGYEASLELRKLYEFVPDSAADKHGQIRIIDESGEDYIYPASLFVHIKLPATVTDRIEHAA